MGDLKLINRDLNFIFKELISAYREMTERYEIMLGIVEEENLFLKKGELDRVNETLSKKNYLIMEIDEISGNIRDLKAGFGNSTMVNELEMPELKGLVSDLIWNELYEAIDEVKNLIVKIKKIQDENQAILMNSFEGLKESITKLKTYKRIISSYHFNKSDIEPRFIDKRK